MSRTDDSLSALNNSTTFNNQPTSSEPNSPSNLRTVLNNYASPKLVSKLLHPNRTWRAEVIAAFRARNAANPQVPSQSGPLQAASTLLDAFTDGAENPDLIYNDPNLTEDEQLLNTLRTLIERSMLHHGKEYKLNGSLQRALAAINIPDFIDSARVALYNYVRNNFSANLFHPKRQWREEVRAVLSERDLSTDQLLTGEQLLNRLASAISNVPEKKYDPKGLLQKNLAAVGILDFHTKVQSHQPAQDTAVQDTASLHEPQP